MKSMGRLGNSRSYSNALLCITVFTLMSTLLVIHVEARKPKPNIRNGGDKEPTVTTETELAETKDTKRIITNLHQNYQSSSTSLDAVTKRLEDDFKVRWRRTLKEIKESNPVVFSPAGLAEERLMQSRERERRTSGKIFLEKWKQFLDSGVGSSTSVPPLPSEVEETREDETSSSKPTNTVRPPPRFDGIQTWDKQLQQWADDVSLYLSETESQINELLPPREPSARYDFSSFGFTFQDNTNKRHLTQEEVNTEGQPLTTRKPKKPKRKGTFTASAAGTLPVALTALDKTLPPIPRPRPVTSSDVILSHTDIADKSKNIWIVTTGALPWMTGTSVNPLLRAAYLSTGRKDAGGSVTLLLPWVERGKDQERIYGSVGMFEAPDNQEEYVRNWLRDTASMKSASEELNIRWYTAWQEVLENSLYSMGDLIGLIPEEECDICILEEPEHLNWYRAPGENWTSKFKHVVGIVHTNYFVYATEQPAAFIRAPAMRLLSSWMCRAHCHRLIKLSGTLQQFAPEKELVENVHGVRQSFLDIGGELQTKLLKSSGEDSDPIFSPDAAPTIYFIGKMLWSKGIGSLMDLMKYAEESAGLRVKVDMYGGGPNKDDGKAKAERMGLDMTFHGSVDHAELGWTQKIFINPSTSEVLCTTVAEALAMGKFVVLPSHPSNDFFAQFPNCLPYTDKEEFVGNLYYALTHSPEPLTEEYSYALSWEAATERFAAAGSISVTEAEAMEEALSSTEAGIEIDLPPIAASEERRKQISQSFGRTRGRYRNFRSRLSQEITKSNVLPKELQQRLITELDKRLDVDLDELLSSPKLRVNISPAKLDKRLLELYDSVIEGPRGDVFRVIGGGATVGRQNLYVKQQQSKLVNPQYQGEPLVVDTARVSDVAEHSDPTILVKRALKRNLRQKRWNFRSANISDSAEAKTSEAPKMSLLARNVRLDLSWGVRLVHHGSFTPSRPPVSRYCPLI